MTRRLAAAVAAAAMSVAVVGVATPADAAGAKKYASCAKLHKVYPHGVAKSRAAAQKQVRAGYGRPAFGKTAVKVYRLNKGRLDRDKDGTACEA